MQNNSTTVASWDADLIALRDEIFSQGGVTLREAAQMACNSIGMLETYAAEWDIYADAELLAAYWPNVGEGEEITPAPEPAPAAAPVLVRTAADRARDKAAYLLSQGLHVVAMGSAYLVPSGSRNAMVHRVEAGQCSCEAAQHGRSCWHVAAIELSQPQQRKAA